MTKELDSKDDLGSMSLNDAQLREEAITKFWEVARKQEALLFQKSQFRWIKDGDKNTRFFHSIVNYIRKVNLIRGLNIQGSWVEDPEVVKSKIK